MVGVAAAGPSLRSAWMAAASRLDAGTVDASATMYPLQLLASQPLTQEAHVALRRRSFFPSAPRYFAWSSPPSPMWMAAVTIM